MYQYFSIPTLCPVCGQPTIIKMDGNSKFLFCPNEACNSRLLNRLDHFCSKKGLDIKGLSKMTIAKLIDLGWINEFADLYTLKEHRDEWISQPGFGEKSVDNILAAIENSRTTSYDKFLAAIGIPQIGNSLVKDLINTPNTCDYKTFRESINNNWDFTQIEGIGPEKANSILSFDYSEADKVFKEFESMTSKNEKDSSNSFKGLTIVITGTLEHFKNRTEFINLITTNGGKVTTSVSKNTSILINNNIESSSSKNRDAKRLGVPILTEQEFLDKYLTF